VGDWSSDFELLYGDWELLYKISGKLANVQLDISVWPITLGALGKGRVL